MICPYCKKESTINSFFCSECGQNISNTSCSDKANSYWDKVNFEETERNQLLQSLINKEAQEIRIRKNKAFRTSIFIFILVLVGCLGFYKIQQYQTQMIDQVKAELIGKTMTAHSTHMEGLGWIHHEYWQLTFIDKSTLEYAYIQTVGPAEDDEKPKYQGSFTYSISRSLTGKYTIRVNNETYELKVNDDNIPKSISH